MADAAARHGISRQAVHQAWRKLYPNDPLPRSLLAQARRTQILELGQSGKTNSEIASILSISMTLVKDALKESGLSASNSAALDLAVEEVQSGRKSAVDAAIDAQIGLWTLTRRLAKLGIKSKRGSTDKTGRVARAVALVQSGQSVAEACRVERCANSAVYAALSKLKRE